LFALYLNIINSKKKKKTLEWLKKSLEKLSKDRVYTLEVKGIERNAGQPIESAMTLSPRNFSPLPGMQ